MKTKIKIKLLLGLIIMFGLTQTVSAQMTMATTILTIINNRTCDVTVNWEVSDCNGCPASCAYCNSYTQTGATPPYFVIPGGGVPASTFTVDIATQSMNGVSCSFYNTSTPFDVFVGLIEINYQGTGTWGGVSCGCSMPLPYNCFSSTTTAGGSATVGPTGCTASWSMTWVSNSTGVVVTIN